MSANSLQGQVEGGPRVDFKNTGVRMHCMWPNFQLFNIIFGQRMLNMTGRAYVIEPKNNLVLELIYNPNNSKGIASLFSKRFHIDQITGGIYKVHPHVMQTFVDASKANADKSKLAIDPSKDIIQLIS